MLTENGRGGLDEFAPTLVKKPPTDPLLRVQLWMWFCSELCLLARSSSELAWILRQSTDILCELPCKIELYHWRHCGGRSKPWCNRQTSAERTAGIPIVQCQLRGDVSSYAVRIDAGHCSEEVWCWLVICSVELVNHCCCVEKLSQRPREMAMVSVW